MGSQQILSFMKTQPRPKKKGLIYIEVSIKGRKLNALIDIGAFDVFISEEAATKLNLKLEKSQGWLKIVNSNKVSTAGIARGVNLSIRAWKGKEDIEVIPLDDYELVIGMNFFDRIDASIVTHVDALYIFDLDYKCVVPMPRHTSQTEKFLFAMQLLDGRVKYKDGGDPRKRIPTKEDRGFRRHETYFEDLDIYKSLGWLGLLRTYCNLPTTNINMDRW